MKIFSQPERNKSSASEGPKKSSKNKGNNPKIRGQASVKATLTEAEIRDKLATHVQTSNSAKSQVVKKNSQALGAGFMNPDAKTQVVKETSETPAESKTEESKSLKDSHLLLSDVKLNDPNDSNTQEKLKMVLSTGGFNFNPKERENLERILSGS